MLIFEGSISHRVFINQIDPDKHASFDEIMFALAKGATISMFVYYFFKALIFVHDRQWSLIKGFWGWWYVLEVIGVLLIPCFLFAYGVRHRRLGVVKVAAVLTILGVILNRLNISVIAFNWNSSTTYFPTWMEFVVTLMVIFTEVWVFRWIVLRMPVLREAHELPGAGTKTLPIPAQSSR